MTAPDPLAALRAAARKRRRTRTVSLRRFTLDNDDHTP